LAATPRIALFSLQRGPEAEQIRLLGSDTIRAAEREGGDIVDTAATILNLDLVISVDTMVAHLAGALGKPVWTILPFAADWRWMLGRCDSVWYPTMRLFRQEQSGDWTLCVAQMHAALRRFAEGRPARPPFDRQVVL
jgi:ADP-heptose:LPS heptosyltransferase